MRLGVPVCSAVLVAVTVVLPPDRSTVTSAVPRLRIATYGGNARLRVNRIKEGVAMVSGVRPGWVSAAVSGVAPDADREVSMRC